MVVVDVAVQSESSVMFRFACVQYVLVPIQIHMNDILTLVALMRRCMVMSSTLHSHNTVFWHASTIRLSPSRAMPYDYRILLNRHVAASQASMF